MNDRPKGLFQKHGVWWLTRQRNGIRKRISLETKDYSEAIQKVKVLLELPELGVGLEREAELEEWIANRKASDKCSPKTEKLARLACGRFFEWLDDRPLAAVNSSVLATFHHSLAPAPAFEGGRQPVATLSEHTRLIYVRTVRSFVGWLYKQGKLRDDPRRGLELPRPEKRARKGFVSAVERDKILNAATGELRVALALGFLAGLRVREIVEARSEWVSSDLKVLHVAGTPTFRVKDRERRDIPISSDLRKMLEEVGIRSPFLVAPGVPHGESDTAYRWDFTRPFKELMKRAGHPKLTPHDMRRSFASNLAAAGVSMTKIAAWLGDGIQVVETHYAHLQGHDQDIERLHYKVKDPNQSR